MHFQLLTVSELLELIKSINNLQQEDEQGWENCLSMFWLQVYFSSSPWSDSFPTGGEKTWVRSFTGNSAPSELNSELLDSFCLSVTLLCKSANKIWQLNVLFSIINYTWECICSLLWICTDTLFFAITSLFCQTVFWNLTRGQRMFIELINYFSFSFFNLSIRLQFHLFTRHSNTFWPKIPSRYFYGCSHPDSQGDFTCATDRDK